MPEPNNSNQPQQPRNSHILSGPDIFRNFFEGQIHSVLAVEVGIANPRVIGYVADLIVAEGPKQKSLQFKGSAGPLYSIVNFRMLLNEYEAPERRSGLVQLGNIILTRLYLTLPSTAIPKAALDIGSEAYSEAAEINFVEDPNPDSELLQELSHNYHYIASGIAQVGRELNLR